jgi:DNA-binding XRE family transcriptional regulator
MNFKISIAAARVNAEMKQSEAAKAIGVLPQTLRNWEKGKTHPKANQVLKMCEIYGVPTDRIFFKS